MRCCSHRVGKKRRFDALALNSYKQTIMYQYMKKILVTLQNHKVRRPPLRLALAYVQSHSYPFLAPVSAEEVSDYYAVITNPMDLSKVGQKITNQEYPSFAEMKKDLDLIWSNCYAYNHDLVLLE